MMAITTSISTSVKALRRAGSSCSVKAAGRGGGGGGRKAWRGARGRGGAELADEFGTADGIKSGAL